MSPAQVAGPLALSAPTPSQRAMFAARLANRERGAKKNSGLQEKTKFGLLHTLAEAAEEVGVSRGAVILAKQIRREAAPEVTAAIEAGRLTLPSGHDADGYLGLGYP